MGKKIRPRAGNNRPDREDTKQSRPETGKSSESKSQAKAVTVKDRAELSSTVPFNLQQSVLDFFTTAFSDVLDITQIDTKLYPLLQEVKGHLFNRDFESAFGRRDYLEVYAARWSASRALGYVEPFADVLARAAAPKREVAVVNGEAPDIGRLCLDDDDKASPINILCFGGGAAELCALVAAQTLSCPNIPLHLRLIDQADWSQVVSKLETAIVTPKAAGRQPLINATLLTTTFQQLDLLQPTQNPASTSYSPMLPASIASAQIVTLAFTLNEFYTTTIPKTQRFLLNLTANTKKGTLLLVVDSPGSYSTVTLNGAEKRYPMQWLLQHTLLTTAPKALAGEDVPVPPPLWKLVDSTDSRWFRLPSGLRYPMDLENMRYQMSLWRRL